jgi:hypothetical protein
MAISVWVRLHHGPRPLPSASTSPRPRWVHAISWVRAMTGRLSWSLPSAGDGGEDSEIEDATEVVVGDEWSGTVELRRKGGVLFGRSCEGQVGAAEGKRGEGG